MYDQNNIFAKILRGDISCQSIYEDEHCLSFRDIFPQAPVHVLVIPKGAYQDFEDFHQNANPSQILGFYKGVQQVINLLNLEKGYRLITNKGELGGQTVPHYHVHILSGRPLGGKVVADA
ncbi:MAG: putative HIT-like protein [Holosporales bacterium]